MAAQQPWGVDMGGGFRVMEAQRMYIQWLRNHLPAIAYIINFYVLLIAKSGASLQCFCNCCCTDMHMVQFWGAEPPKLYDKGG